jgi:hypothetical protein
VFWYAYCSIGIQMKRDPSRLRQELRRVEDARAPHVEALMAVREALRRGSFVTLHRRCGKTACHCAEGEGHPGKYLSLKEGGRTRLVYVGPGEEMAVGEANGRYREFRQHRTALAKLGQQTLELINRLGAALTMPEPRPRGRRRARR